MTNCPSFVSLSAPGPSDTIDCPAEDAVSPRAARTMRKCPILIMLLCALLALWPNDDVVTGSDALRVRVL